MIVPARNEAGSVGLTVRSLHAVLKDHAVPHEIVVVDDGSTDHTWAVLDDAVGELPVLKPIRNAPPHGFGHAIRCGLCHYAGDAAVIVMADGSEEPGDVVRYWERLCEGYDCVFGSRFVPGGATHDYPAFKYALNRLANLFIRCLFRHGYNDTTNAFKAYRRHAIDACGPLRSEQFELTVELPLKAISSGCSWTVVPTSWRNRRAGESKLKIREIGSRYLSTITSVYRGGHRPRTPRESRTQQKAAGGSS